jgi:hypothetical protein
MVILLGQRAPRRIMAHNQMPAWMQGRADGVRGAEQAAVFGGGARDGGWREVEEKQGVALGRFWGGAAWKVEA